MSNNQNNSPLVSLNPNEAATSAGNSGYPPISTPTKTSQHKAVLREVIIIILYLFT